jgi:hypothetical protein
MSGYKSYCTRPEVACDDAGMRATINGRRWKARTESSLGNRGDGGRPERRDARDAARAQLTFSGVSAFLPSLRTHKK